MVDDKRKNLIPFNLFHSKILITSFDNVIEFNIAQDINSNGEPIPYDLSVLSTNSNLKLVFKSDSEKLEKDPFFEANNNYELGNISFRIQEKDHKLLRRIYDKGYDNFYLVVVATNSTTQLYSGKFVFYEDVTFVNGTSTGTTTGSTSTTSRPDVIVTNTEKADSVTPAVDVAANQNNPYSKDNMPTYTEDSTTDKNYTNLMIYVKGSTNISKMDAYLAGAGIAPDIKYANVYFLKRIYNTIVVNIKALDFVDKVFEIPISTGQAPQSLTTDKETSSTTTANTTAPTSPYTPPKQPFTPPIPTYNTVPHTISTAISGSWTFGNTL